jgi:hypothetical protein
MRNSAADGKHSMHFSLTWKKLLVPRCSTSTKHVSASRRRCSETVDCPTSTPATISPTDTGRRSFANCGRRKTPPDRRKSLQIAQTQKRVHTTENRGVPGSSPGLAIARSRAVPQFPGFLGVLSNPSGRRRNGRRKGDGRRRQRRPRCCDAASQRRLQAALEPNTTRVSQAPAAGQSERRYWWIIRTAIAPSPTAEATRLIEPERTSPAANTPGRLVSSGSGGRSRPARAGSR